MHTRSQFLIWYVLTLKHILVYNFFSRALVSNSYYVYQKINSAEIFDKKKTNIYNAVGR